jgi:hypothetical protein
MGVQHTQGGDMLHAAKGMTCCALHTRGHNRPRGWHAVRCTPRAQHVTPWVCCVPWCAVHSTSSPLQRAAYHPLGCAAPPWACCTPWINWPKWFLIVFEWLFCDVWAIANWFLGDFDCFSCFRKCWVIVEWCLPGFRLILSAASVILELFLSDCLFYFIFCWGGVISWVIHCEMEIQVFILQGWIAK